MKTFKKRGFSSKSIGIGTALLVGRDPKLVAKTLANKEVLKILGSKSGSRVLIGSDQRPSDSSREMRCSESC